MRRLGLALAARSIDTILWCLFLTATCKAVSKNKKKNTKIKYRKQIKRQKNISRINFLIAFYQKIEKRNSNKT